MSVTYDLTGNAIKADSLTMSGAASVSGVTVTAGSGAPTASLPQGSLYLRTDGSSTSTRLYVSSATPGTWIAVTTAS